MISQRIAVVTGGNRGLGLEIGRQLAARGLTVVLTARDGEKAQQAAAQIAAEGGRVIPHPLEVGDEASVAELVGFLERELGGADVLVNNAGIFLDRHVGGLEVPIDLVRRTLDTNLLGPWRLAQALVPLFSARGYGRLVNLSSDLGASATMRGGYAAYRVSKAALNTLTRILADELAGTPILVNALSPGWVQTDMGGPHAPQSVEQGADTAVWLATLPDGGPTGGFFRDRRPIPW